MKKRISLLLALTLLATLLLPGLTALARTEYNVNLLPTDLNRMQPLADVYVNNFNDGRNVAEPGDEVELIVDPHYVDAFDHWEIYATNRNITVKNAYKTGWEIGSAYTGGATFTMPDAHVTAEMKFPKGSWTINNSDPDHISISVNGEKRTGAMVYAHAGDEIYLLYDELYWEAFNDFYVEKKDGGGIDLLPFSDPYSVYFIMPHTTVTVTANMQAGDYKINMLGKGGLAVNADGTKAEVASPGDEIDVYIGMDENGDLLPGYDAYLDAFQEFEFSSGKYATIVYEKNPYMLMGTFVMPAHDVELWPVYSTEKHTITYADTVSDHSGFTEAAPLTEVTVSTYGDRFLSWIIEDDNGSSIIDTYGMGPTATFLMPNRNVTVTPELSVNGVVMEIDAPEVGKTPSYEIKMRSPDGSPNGCLADVAYNSDGWQHGIRWYDVTDNTAISGDAKFQAGHMYRVDIKLELLPHFAWAIGEGDVVTTTATVNDCNADFDAPKEIVRFTFDSLPNIFPIVATNCKAKLGDTVVTEAEAGAILWIQADFPPEGKYLDHYIIDGQTFEETTDYKMPAYELAAEAVFKDQIKITVDLTGGSAKVDADFAKAYQYFLVGGGDLDGDGKDDIELKYDEGFANAVITVLKDCKLTGTVSDRMWVATAPFKYITTWKFAPAPTDTDKPTDKPTETTPPPAEDRLPGDVTGDGKVNIMDVIRLLKKVSGWTVEIVEKNADVTGDGNIDIMDVIRLLKKVSGWNVELK